MPSPSSDRPRRRLTHEGVLAVAVAIEIACFAAIGSNFVSAGNAVEIARASGEIALLALAQTAVILTGGIDLSMGSLLGLSAVVMGAAWHDLGLPMAVAVLVAPAVGMAGGALNAVLVSRLGLPPLIVTLGTYSLFRGIAEGMTAGVRNYTGFPQAFLFLGQGHLPGGVPVQLPLVLLAALSFWLLVHRTPIGRGLRAIGFSPEGARYAGIPVARRLAAAYVLSGLAAGVAATVYAARLGQAKADAGTGFELLAITAVVLGGTSIFGGRGTIFGTFVAAFVIGAIEPGIVSLGWTGLLTQVIYGAVIVGALIMQSVVMKRVR